MDKLSVPYQEISLLDHVSYTVEDGSLLILPLEVDVEVCLEHCEPSYLGWFVAFLLSNFF